MRHGKKLDINISRRKSRNMDTTSQVTKQSGASTSFNRSVHKADSCHSKHCDKWKPLQDTTPSEERTERDQEEIWLLEPRILRKNSSQSIFSQEKQQCEAEEGLPSDSGYPQSAQSPNSDSVQECVTASRIKCCQKNYRGIRRPDSPYPNIKKMEHHHCCSPTYHHSGQGECPCHVEYTNDVQPSPKDKNVKSTHDSQASSPKVYTSNKCCHTRESSERHCHPPPRHEDKEDLLYRRIPRSFPYSSTIKRSQSLEDIRDRLHVLISREQFVADALADRQASLEVQMKRSDKLLRATSHYVDCSSLAEMAMDRLRTVVLEFVGDHEPIRKQNDTHEAQTISEESEPSVFPKYLPKDIQENEQNWTELERRLAALKEEGNDLLRPLENLIYEYEKKRQDHAVAASNFLAYLQDPRISSKQLLKLEAQYKNLTTCLHRVHYQLEQQLPRAVASRANMVSQVLNQLGMALASNSKRAMQIHSLSRSLLSSTEQSQMDGGNSTVTHVADLCDGDDLPTCLPEIPLGRQISKSEVNQQCGSSHSLVRAVPYQREDSSQSSSDKYQEENNELDVVPEQLHHDSNPQQTRDTNENDETREQIIDSSTVSPRRMGKMVAAAVANLEYQHQLDCLCEVCPTSAHSRVMSDIRNLFEPCTTKHLTIHTAPTSPRS